MPRDPVHVLQLELFLSDAAAYRDAIAHYEAIRPVLQREWTLAHHSQATGTSYWRLWRDVRRFRQAGILGLLDRRRRPHPCGKVPPHTCLPEHIQHHVVRLAMAHPFTTMLLSARSRGQSGRDDMRLSRLTPPTWRCSTTSCAVPSKPMRSPSQTPPRSGKLLSILASP
jgi:hypothetical protein